VVLTYAISWHGFLSYIWHQLLVTSADPVVVPKSRGCSEHITHTKCTG